MSDDLQEIRERLAVGYLLRHNHGWRPGFSEAVVDIGFLLAEVDRQAAEIERLRTLADALAFPVEAGW